VFDTRDAALPRGRADRRRPKAFGCRNYSPAFDVPELEPGAARSCRDQAFYLIDGFVGRTTIGQTWIEALPPPDPSDTSVRPARAGDTRFADRHHLERSGGRLGRRQRGPAAVSASFRAARASAN